MKISHKDLFASCLGSLTKYFPLTQLSWRIIQAELSGDKNIQVRNINQCRKRRIKQLKFVQRIHNLTSTPEDNFSRRHYKVLRINYLHSRKKYKTPGPGSAYSRGNRRK